MDLQELISRGRFIFAGAAERLNVYELVDGRRTARDISRATKRHINNIFRDLRRLADVGLIEKRQIDGKIIEKDGLTLYQRTPIARAVPISYFRGPAKLSGGRIVSEKCVDGQKVYCSFSLSRMNRRAAWRFGRILNTASLPSLVIRPLPTP